jgi:hypothetical protein
MHTIRLRGPWQIEALLRFVPDALGEVHEETSQLPIANETSVPGDWAFALGEDFRGRARYVRRFGLPTNLEPQETVTLVFGEVESQATIELNGTLLGEQRKADGERRYEVTQLLKLRNELRIVVEARDAVGGILGEVKLEIASD